MFAMGFASLHPSYVSALAVTDGATAAAKQPDGQILAGDVGQISDLTPRVSRQMRGDRDRHERAVGCGGRELRGRRARMKRTAKSCGPDAAVLASSRAGSFLSGDGGKRAVHRGEHEVSCKATAHEKYACKKPL